MRQTIRDFVSLAAATLPIAEPIWEFGALQVPGQEGFADLRSIFPGRQYFGADVREGPGVDRVLDLHRIDLPAGSAGTVICVDTLEHVEYPHRALEEMHRILRPDGIVVISSVMAFAIHDFPQDYWRFTPEGLKSLLKPFAGSFVGFAGDPGFPHTVVGVGFKGSAPDLSAFSGRFAEWQRKQEPEKPVTPRTQTPEPAPGRAFRHAVRLVTPPLLHPVLSKLYRATLGRGRRPG